jgi:hypothetical protein
MSSQCRGGEVVVDAEVAFAAPSIDVEHHSSQQQLHHEQQQHPQRQRPQGSGPRRQGCVRGTVLLASRRNRGG